MSLLVPHPDDWIGVPERWPFPDRRTGGSIASAGAWLEELVAAFRDEQVTPEAREHARQVLAMLLERGERTGLRHYVRFTDRPDSETGIGAQVVEAEALDERLLGTRPLTELILDGEERPMLPPTVEEFSSASGVSGVSCVRYVTHEGASLTGRVDYAFHHDGVVLILRASEIDMTEFEKLIPAVRSLAECVTVIADGAE